MQTAQSKREWVLGYFMGVCIARRMCLILKHEMVSFGAAVTPEDSMDADANTRRPTFLENASEGFAHRGDIFASEEAGARSQISDNHLGTRVNAHLEIQKHSQALPEHAHSKHFLVGSSTRHFKFDSGVF